MKLSRSDIQKIQHYFASQKDVVAVYLYGSFAKSTTHPRSDIDFGVLFDRKVDFHRLGQIYSDLSDLKLPTEPEVRDIDLTQNSLYLRNVIQGQLIFCKDEVKRIHFEVTTMKLFRDTEHLRNIQNYYMSRRLKEGSYGFRQSYIR